MVDETVLEGKLAEELLEGWEVIPTGSGFLVTTAWRWPNDEMIEIHVRRVAERDDLYLVTDGGALFNFLFAGGIDLRQNDREMEMLHQIVARSDAGIIDYQIVKGANNEELPQSIRLVVEAVKEGAFIFWHRLG
jgi:diacylglycerol kinase family enzyme